jgi:SCY1-like protein 1
MLRFFRIDPSAADAYALGVLLHSCFNPSHPPPATTEPPHPPPQASSKGAIPTVIFTPFKRLVNPNAKARLSPKGFLEIGMVESGFFANNRLVQVCNGLDNFALASEGDKNALLRLVLFLQLMIL